jgi:hypothetical protein
MREELYKKNKIPDKKERVRINKEKALALTNPGRKIIHPTRQEIKPIAGENWIEFKPNYFVSDLGRAKVIKTFATGEVKELELIGRKGDKQKTVLTGHGYLARLVLIHFRPVENMENKFVIFLDCDCTNAKLSNLSWVDSRPEYFEHAKKCGQSTAYSKTKEVIDVEGNIKKRKVAFSDADVAEIRRLRKSGISTTKISELMGCSTAYVSLIINNRHRVLKTSKPKPR